MSCNSRNILKGKLEVRKYVPKSRRRRWEKTRLCKGHYKFFRSQYSSSRVLGAGYKICLGNTWHSRRILHSQNSTKWQLGLRRYVHPIKGSVVSAIPLPSNKDICAYHTVAVNSTNNKIKLLLGKMSPRGQRKRSPGQQPSVSMT